MMIGEFVPADRVGGGVSGAPGHHVNLVGSDGVSTPQITLTARLSTSALSHAVSPETLLLALAGKVLTTGDVAPGSDATTVRGRLAAPAEWFELTFRALLEAQPSGNVNPTAEVFPSPRGIIQPATRRVDHGRVLDGVRLTRLRDPVAAVGLLIFPVFGALAEFERNRTG